MPPGGGGGPGGGAPNHPPGALPAPKKPPTPLERFKEKSKSWVQNKLDDWADSLADRDGIEDNATLRQLSRWLGDTRPEGFRFDPAQQAPGWLGKLHADQWFGDMAGLHSPVGEPSLPSWMQPGDVPTLGSAPDVSMGDALDGILWVLLLGALGVALWCGQALYRDRIRDALVHRWKLGPWPVDPSAIRSPRELIQAFEYLALLLLGFEARSRHHLDLAEQLSSRANTNPARQYQAAHQLAHLYEQARYDPAGSALSETDLLRARKYLCFLAGRANT
jgi:hypothetical protein